MMTIFQFYHTYVMILLYLGKYSLFTLIPHMLQEMCLNLEHKKMRMLMSKREINISNSCAKDSFFYENCYLKMVQFMCI